MTNTRTTRLKGRHLVLIDFENMAGTADPTPGEVDGVALTLRDAVPAFDGAHVVVACSHHAARTVAFAFPRARHLWRSGPDGADLALLDVLDNERVDQRFEHVTICSGDGIFAASAALLGGAGVKVTVVSLHGHLATRLRLAARSVVYLPTVAADVTTGSAS